MIPFEEIDQRLKALGENRLWLATVTGRSENSIRAALAPRASESKRSELLQRVLSDAIEREEAARATPSIPGVFDVLVTPEQIDGAYRAAAALHIDDITVFCREAIGFRADEINSGNVDPVTKLVHPPGNGLQSMPAPVTPKENHG